MELHFVGKKIDVPQRVQEYAEQKLSKLERYVPAISGAQVELSLEQTRSAQDRTVVQVTLNINGTILRAQERAAEFHLAIDRVTRSLESQAKRFKAKHCRSEQRRGGKISEALAEPPTTDEPARVVRRKQFAMKPMEPEDAIDEMELLGHDFFLFQNAATQTFNVVYRRSGGDYGLIEPEA